MRRSGLAFSLGGLVALLVLSAGCASVPPTASPAAAPTLPDWVTVVPRPSAEQTFYVGGCAAAPDTTSGLREAEADARAQAGNAGREQITPVVESSFHEAGVETTAMERAQFRLLVIEPVVERLAATLRRTRAFHRDCAVPPAAGAGAGICDVFVLMTVDRTAWKRLPVEVVADLRKQKQTEAAGGTSVALLDWILRHYSDADPAPEAGGRGSERP